MPRTVEHIVETHRIASNLRRAGRPIWSETIDLSAFWGDNSLDFETKRDMICGAFRRSRWHKNADPDAFDGIIEIVDHLADAEDWDDFNGWWDEMYDLADYARIWIKLHG